MSEEKYATKKFLQKNSEIIEDLEEEKDEDVGLDLETGENLDLKPSEEDLDVDTPEDEIKDEETEEKDEEDEIIEEKQIEVVTKPKKASNKAILKPKTNK